MSDDASTVAATAQPALLVDRQGDITRLTLNRPQRGNALSAELVQALHDAVLACQRDGTRLLLIEGAGKHFCTGFDLADLDGETDDTLLARFVRVELMLQAVYTAPFTTVARVHGRAMGAGADLAAACEQCWVAADSRFAFPGAAFGLVLGTARLAARVGPTLARQWIGAGATIDADTALATGLASRDFEADEHGKPDTALEALARQARRLDTDTQAAIHAASRADGDELARQLAALVHSAARPGLRERIRAYRAASAR
ncbi:enoyl-CoA hydratase/isomerase family protein [Cupriavidus cauae]|uniref:enoyl-CoA hydratase/isomerase family protein n=1 Tax=Cupriavidus cauae TaxID=2608999 RepID=UPI0011ED3A78|nr:enoyl-CoA hydratase/isomerase family protein [Cupriavidus cauae]KAA0180357.1 enoyl-CoA hydratase/isomerase family protein [Cupriavidus gilardii]UZN50787.1 enoyl-CoA hydratase/isomerase family protein [Cupriavidus cauae]